MRNKRENKKYEQVRKTLTKISLILTFVATGRNFHFTPAMFLNEK